MTSPFDFIKDQSYDKKDIFCESEENMSGYNQYMINRGFSYFPDTILHADQMNLLQNLEDSYHNKYLLEAIPKRKRFSKWYKPQKDDTITLLMEFYKCSKTKAEYYREILRPSDIEKIRNASEKGGKT